MVAKKARGEKGREDGERTQGSAGEPPHGEQPRPLGRRDEALHGLEVGILRGQMPPRKRVRWLGRQVVVGAHGCAQAERSREELRGPAPHLHSLECSVVDVARSRLPRVVGTQFLLQPSWPPIRPSLILDLGPVDNIDCSHSSELARQSRSNEGFEVMS